MIGVVNEINSLFSSLEAFELRQQPVCAQTGPQAPEPINVGSFIAKEKQSLEAECASLHRANSELQTRLDSLMAALEAEERLHSHSDA